MTAITIYIAFWFILMFLGIVNGVLREKTYGYRLSELRAHQLSTVTGILAMTAAVSALAAVVPITSSDMAIRIGAVWLLLTVTFEFTFGRLVAGHSWKRLLADYNLLAGRLWSLFLLWISLLPLLVFFTR